jgi:hypothetical protein
MTIEATLARVVAIRQALADPATLIGSSSGTAVTGGVEAPAATPTPTSGSSFADALAQASGESAPATQDPTAYAGFSPGASTDTDMAMGAGADTGAVAGLPSSAAVASPYASLLQGASGVVGTSALGVNAGGSVGERIVAIAESQLGQTEQPPGSNESPAIAEYRSATAGAIPGAPWCAYFASWVARQAGEPIGEGGQGAGAVSEVWSWAQSSGRAIPNGPGVVPKPGDLIVFGDEHVGIVRDVLPNGQIQTIEGNYENKVAANVRTPTEATGYVEMS